MTVEAELNLILHKKRNHITIKLQRQCFKKGVPRVSMYEFWAKTLD